MTESNLITPEEVASMLALSKRTMYRALKRGSLDGFPEPYRYSDKLMRWNKEEIEKWMATRRAPKV